MPTDLQTISSIAIFALIIAFFALLLAIMNFIRTSNLKRTIEIMFSGKEVANLETLILQHSEELSQLDKEIQELFEISNKIHNLAASSIHKVDVLRFNPFKDIGGDQSFAISLLNGKNSGLVISSLHTREGTRVYAKPIFKGQSEKYTLTEEEKISLKSAISTKPTKV
jgi:hypothetical protein